MTIQTIPRGAHIRLRDAVWRVVQTNPTSNGTHEWRVIGVSEIVRDQEAVFLEDYEPAVEVLDPRQTKLVVDESSMHKAGLLYIESLLRDVPPEGDEVSIGHRAAMDVLDYQLEPARLALGQLRARILIADGVGLGKTLEAGIVLSELIRRGRGRRILVVTVKSMLTQFQKELWSRFTIPLVRLDSVGLQRIQSRIPANQNPFHFFDRVIISVDTLKQHNAFRTHVEQARWDVIVIDEAHNVAERGEGRLRNRLARTLAHRSDALLMLSATPHDGRARSFASLMNMLNPTAIADADKYGPEDIRGLFIRRFKKDVEAELGKKVPDRKMLVATCQASPAEEEAFRALAELSFARIDRQLHGGMLFKTTLEKALFSSPGACSQTIDTRIGNLRKDQRAVDYAADIAALEHVSEVVSSIGPADFSRYQRLVQLLRKGEGDFRWSRGPKDRLVIFTERIDTLEFLHEHLKKDLGLDDRQVAMLDGSMSDVEQQELVDKFGQERSPLRLLLASDVASEGINLHFLCHKLIHFDIPWSLMVFQQRNGRIDRYGQEHQPRIVYLMTESSHPKIRGDLHILEILLRKEDEAHRNIGDPSALVGIYDIDKQEEQVAKAMEERVTPERFAAKLDQKNVDPLEVLLGLAAAPSQPTPTSVAPVPTLFLDDFTYLRMALDYLREVEVDLSRAPEVRVREADRIIELGLTPDLNRRFEKLPEEVYPEDGKLLMCDRPDRVQRSIRDARAEESSWPALSYLWPLHPVLGWVADKMRGRFGQNQAPVLRLVEGLTPGERVVLVSALLTNRRSQPLIHRWFAVSFVGQRRPRVEELAAFLARSGLASRSHPNREAPVNLDRLEGLVPKAIDAVDERVAEIRQDFEKGLRTRLLDELSRLEELKARQVQQLELKFAQRPGTRADDDRSSAQRRVDELFARHDSWVRESMTTEANPFLQVIAALVDDSPDGKRSRS